MSGRPRSDVIDESKVGVYHVWNRCIRQMFLFGADRYSGRDYTSRKALLQERLRELTAIFAVDACVWAMLSNHFHLIVRNRPDLAQQFSDEEVASLVVSVSRASRRTGSPRAAHTAGNPVDRRIARPDRRVAEAIEQHFLVHEIAGRVAGEAS